MKEKLANRNNLCTILQENKNGFGVANIPKLYT